MGTASSRSSADGSTACAGLLPVDGDGSPQSPSDRDASSLGGLGTKKKEDDKNKDCHDFIERDTLIELSAKKEDR